MSIQIWDNHNRQWLEPIAIFFGKENTVWKVQACLPGANPLTDGWYDIEGDALSRIAITGEISHNTGLLPKEK